MTLLGISEAPLSDDLLYGNRELIAYFNDALASSKLPHAHILEGPEGSGKHTIAYAVAAALDGGEFSEKIKEGLCPDIMEYGLTGSNRSIGVETVRTMKEAAFITPNELEFKMFIISDAHLMTVQAQNALLKLLEEPPKNVYFMLLCENTANLLTTVRSRAPTMRMQSFTDDELDSILCENRKFAEIKNKSPQTFLNAVRSAYGSFGKAAAALNSRSKKNGDASVEAVRALLKMLASSPSEAVLYASKLPSKREDLSGIMSDFRTAVRDLVAVKRTASARTVFYTDRLTAEEDAELFTVKGLVRLYDITGEMLLLLDSNVNVTGAVLVWLNRLSGRMI